MEQELREEFQIIEERFQSMDKSINTYTDYYNKDEGEGGYYDSIGEKYLSPDMSLVQVIERLNEVLEVNEDEKVEIADALGGIKYLFLHIKTHMVTMDVALIQTQREIVKLKTEIRDLNQTVQRLTPIEPGDLPSGGRRKSRRLIKRFRRTSK